MADLPVPNNAAKAGLFSTIQQGLACKDEIVFLVSKEGKEFSIQENVLKGNSDFFKATLENKMRESGKYRAALRPTTASCTVMVLYCVVMVLRNACAIVSDDGSLIRVLSLICMQAPAKSCAILEMSLEALGKIVEGINDDEWSEEPEFSIPIGVTHMRSPATQKGISLECKWGTVQANMDRLHMPDPIKIGSLALTFMGLSSTQVAREGEIL
jgi:hypothetical protein